MANRQTLAVSALEDFKVWLTQNGWEIQETVGYYEALRATKIGQLPLIVYKRLSTYKGSELIHLTVQDKDMKLVRQFLKNQNQGD